jgi:serine/threonine protein kinase/Rieske Fe-S protein
MQTLPVDQLVGQVLGNNRVERLLGQGRLNTVYLARNLSTRDHVALTLFNIPQRLSLDARNRFMQRFRQEAAALTTLRHEHIMPVHDYGEYIGRPYLVTPYMMNGSLADVLKQQGRCAHEDVLDILEQIAAGLGFAHSRGVIHGTLKPSNIVLNDEQMMLVAGFGLMHILQKSGIEPDEQPYAHLFSIADTLLAAPEYIAPEVVQGQSIDVRSDIYSLGMILFELLSGRPAFMGANPLDVARMHVQQSMPSLRALCPDIPIGLISVINQALERDPARRFQSVSELAEAFTQVSIGATSPTLRSFTGAMKAANGVHNGSRSGKLPGTWGEDGSSTNWQLLPPIVTGKLAAVRKPGPPTQRPAGVTDSWQLVPPIVTGQLPAVDASTAQRSAPAQPAPTLPPPPPLQYEPPREKTVAAEPLSPPPPPRRGNMPAAMSPGWWEQPPYENSLRLSDPERERWNPQPGTMQPRPTRPSGPGRGRNRRRGNSLNLSRRQAVAALVSGGVIAAGAAIIVNRSLIHSAQQMLGPHNTTKTQGATQTGTAGQMQIKSTKGKATGTQATTPKPNSTPGHSGAVIGSTKLALNSASDFTNPADGKMSMLIHLPGGKFVAYEKICTHEGVIVHYDPQKQLIVCPLHFSMFDPANNAKVLDGPAPRPLPAVPIRVNTDGTITTM